MASQKAELTKITFSSKTGKATRYTTLTDDYAYHSNYHAFTHGPVKDNEGNRLRSEENRFDLYREMIKFLDKHMKDSIE